MSLYSLRRRYSQWTITQRQSLFIAEYRKGSAIRDLVAFSLDALADALRKADRNPI